ncbi:hypothetical protein PCL_09351 [Purpureocillium lilacinum]|uniref:Uncharacterized protein n=1 Tax=Purpureocillium lilacinum TaxID=33203 RepID=A0A2U3EHS8_PURLI|nr:hypothetical protein Purlil1_718 [Purpureocillium lilacinum]PWI74075.1 hypothetical protein PCL_09351 [Purpureocillium lilacinum]
MEGGRDMTCAPHGAPHRRPATATAVLHLGPSAAAPIPTYASRRRGISTGTGTGTGIVVSFPQQGTAQLCFAPRCTTPPYGSSAEGDGVFVAGVGSCEPEEDIKIQDWAVSPAPSVYRAGAPCLIAYPRAHRTISRMQGQAAPGRAEAYPPGQSWIFGIRAQGSWPRRHTPRLVKFVPARPKIESRGSATNSYESPSELARPVVARRRRAPGSLGFENRGFGANVDGSKGASMGETNLQGDWEDKGLAGD